MGRHGPGLTKATTAAMDIKMLLSDIEVRRIFGYYSVGIGRKAG